SAQKGQHEIHRTPTPNCTPVADIPGKRAQTMDQSAHCASQQYDKKKSVFIVNAPASAKVFQSADALSGSTCFVKTKAFLNARRGFTVGLGDFVCCGDGGRRCTGTLRRGRCNCRSWTNARYRRRLGRL